MIPTRNRPKDLSELLLSILSQIFIPFEVIVIDDSPTHSAEQIINSFSTSYKIRNCELKLVKAYGEGLTAARNLGISHFAGDFILFLDDDTLLHKDTLKVLVTYLEENPQILGVQPLIVNSSGKSFAELTNFENAFCKVMMLSYKAENTLVVRKSGMSISPNYLTKVIPAQRLSGCSCYKREIFNVLKFDTNLKRWGFMEDLDFSFRLYKLHPGYMSVIPQAKILHKVSKTSRLPAKTNIHMVTLYWFYVFFKDIFRGSFFNLVAFLLALWGNFIMNLSGLVIKKKPRSEWWGFIYLLESYFSAFKNLKALLQLRLDFYNCTLNRHFNK